MIAAPTTWTPKNVPSIPATAKPIALSMPGMIRHSRGAILVMFHVEHHRVIASYRFCAMVMSVFLLAMDSCVVPFDVIACVQNP